MRSLLKGCKFCEFRPTVKYLYLFPQNLHSSQYVWYNIYAFLQLQKYYLRYSWGHPDSKIIIAVSLSKPHTGR